MATTEFANPAEGDATTLHISPESPPDDETTPPGESQGESAMLQQMHQFLGKIVEHLPIDKSVASKKCAKR